MSIVSNEHQNGSPFDHPAVETEMPGSERYKFGILEVVGEIHSQVRGTFEAPTHAYMATRVVWLMRRLQYWLKSDSTYDLLVFTLANEALARWHERERRLEMEEP